jgi:hypothetical protein
MTMFITDTGGKFGTRVWHELPTVLVGYRSVDERKTLQWLSKTQDVGSVE